MSRTLAHDHPDYRGICRTLSLGSAANGPYSVFEHGSYVLNLGAIATEILNSEWWAGKLAEVERAAAEKAWHEGSVFGQRTGQGVGAVDQSAYNPYREGKR